MNRNSWRISAAAVFAMSSSTLMVLGGTYETAQATEATPIPACASGYNVDSGNGSCYIDSTSESSSHDSASGSVSTVNGIKFTGKTKTRVLAYVKSTGMSHAQQQNPNRVVLKHGGTYNTSYINVAGQEVWHMKYYPAGKTFIKGPDGYFHDPLCNNKVTGLPKGPKKPPTKHIQLHGHYKLVKVFKFSGSAQATLSESAVAKANAWANGYLYDSAGQIVRDENGQPVRTCHAEASGKGSASFFAQGKASIKGRIYTSVDAAVQAMVSGANANLNAQLGGQTHAQVTGSVKASARGKASADASADASCTDTHQTAPGNKAPTGEIVMFTEHVYVGNFFKYKVVGSDNEDGANVSVTYSVTGAAHVVTNDADHPMYEDNEGVNHVKTFWIQGDRPGDFTVTLTVTDSKGATYTTSITKPVLPREL